MTRPALPALTGLRFFAALQVVCFHLYASIPRLADAPFASVVGLGFSGVSLFFVLSGFILAYNYITPGQPGIGSVRRFVLARVARVYAVYLLGVVLALPIFVRQLLQDGAPLANGVGTVALVVTLLQSWVPSAACRLNCPGWSLSVEAFFYAMFPLLALPLAMLSRRRLIWTALVCWATSMTIASMYVVLRPDGGAIATAALDATWINVLRFNPLLHLAEFVIGMTVGALFLRRDPTVPVPSWAAPVALLAYIAVLLLGRLIPYPMLHNGALAPVVALLLYSLAAGDERVGPRLLATPLMQRLGEASYALYVLHVPFFVWFKKVASVLGGDIDHSRWLPLAYVCASTLMAVLVFVWIEEPVRRFVRRRA